VATGFLTGQGPIYDKSETLLDRYRNHSYEEEGTSAIKEIPQKSKIANSRTSL
jgi:hypothetical protein